MRPDRLLVVDDEAGIRTTLAGILADEGWAVDLAESGEAGLEKARAEAYRAIFLDVWLPGIDGLETLRQIRRLGNETPVIIISGHGSIETAVRATKLGAFDFVEKPLSLEKVLLTLRNALRADRLERQSRSLREQLRRDTELVGDSSATRKLRDDLARIAPTAAGVLLIGERGAGKELAARIIVAGSPRADDAFVQMNCAAVSREHLDEELFGSGPEAARRGRIALARDGTLYLGAIDTLPAEICLRLARAVSVDEAREEDGPASDVRIIGGVAEGEAATRAAAGGSPLDRLHLVPVRVPPLRERAPDIPALTKHYLERFAREYARRPPALRPAAEAALAAWHWPGNVRELRNLVERLVILHDGPAITEDDLPAPLGGKS